MDSEIKIDRFLDGDGRITQLPRKQQQRRALLEYLANKFEPGRDYSEKEVNRLCDDWHTFNDYFILRRDLIEYGFLSRERDGSRYWRNVTEE